MGITADNSANLQSADLQFGNGSLIQDDGQVNLETARYYQRLYGMSNMLEPRVVHAMIVPFSHSFDSILFVVILRTQEKPGWICVNAVSYV